ncbi:hypothetical protein FDG2_2480 [Candidatus Protofrankia californiensis]|uniref:Uncharacterized protein n=2 Tax=Protofrankia TaxID=2994361 RepID=A0A1C3NXQ1_9ACTN|nr:hypothetical protein FDG2_2480 [Candidatus Protofrankia californiensis]
MFFYMYVFRSGWRDGWQGLAFCLYRAWHEKTINLLNTSVAAPQEAVYPFETVAVRTAPLPSPSASLRAS